MQSENWEKVVEIFILLILLIPVYFLDVLWQLIVGARETQNIFGAGFVGLALPQPGFAAERCAKAEPTVNNFKVIAVMYFIFSLL